MLNHCLLWNFFQVLTREEVRQILAARNEKIEKQTRALYDLEGERKKKLTFSKVRETLVPFPDW